MIYSYWVPMFDYFSMYVCSLPCIHNKQEVVKLGWLSHQSGSAAVWVCILEICGARQVVSWHWKWNIMALPALRTLEICFIKSQICLGVGKPKWNLPLFMVQNEKAVIHKEKSAMINSLTPGRFAFNFNCVVLKDISVTDIWIIYHGTTLKWMPKDLTVLSDDGQINIVSGNGLVPSGNNPLPDPMIFWSNTTFFSYIYHGYNNHRYTTTVVI